MSAIATQTVQNESSTRSISPGNRQSSLLTPSALFLGAIGRSFSNTSNSSATIQADVSSRGSSLSPPPFLRASLRRSSDGPVYDNGINSITLGGLARRMPGHDATEQVERNHLLRSVSHLNKDQVAPEQIIDSSDIFDRPIESSPPFTRFDLLPPPTYEQKIRQPRKPAYGVRGGVRGRSYTDARRIGYPSTSMTTNEYMEAMNASTNSGFSHAYKGGSGKAKAIFPSAAAKLRKLSMSNLGSSRKVSVSTPSADDNIKSSGKESPTKASTSVLHCEIQQAPQDLSSSRQEPVQTPSQIMQTSLYDNSNRDFDALLDQIKVEPSSRGSTSGNTVMNGEDVDDAIEAQIDVPSAESDHDATPYASMSNFADKNLISLGLPRDSEIVNGKTINKNLDTNTIPLFKSEKVHPDLKEENSIEQKPRQFDQVVPRRASASTTISSDEVSTSRAIASSLALNYETRRSKDAGYACSNAALSLGDSTSAKGKASVNQSITPQKEGQISASAIVTQKAGVHSLETARSSELQSGEVVSSSSSASRILAPSSSRSVEVTTTGSNLDPSVNCEDPSLTFPTIMANVDNAVNSLVHSRRGSAPIDGHGRRKSAFRFGMMKMNGSNIDISSLEDGARRNSHLEGSHRRQPSEDAISNASSRSHRLSFTINNRPRQSQDGPRSGTFGLLSKLNRSREQLSTNAISNTEPLSIDDTCNHSEVSEKISQKADAKLTARQFLLKAFQRPSLTPVAAMAASNDSAVEHNDTRTSALDSGSNSGSHDSVSTEATEHVFTAAFGTPQRSDSQTGRAFEGKESADTTTDEVEPRRSVRHGEGTTTRSSRDSSGTSFFSLAEGSHSREAGTPSFDRSNSFYRSAGEQLFQTNPAMQTSAASAVPRSEEGPLGESLGDENEVPPFSPAMAYMKSNSTSSARSGEVSNALAETSDASAMPGPKSLGIDEEQNQSCASTLVPVDGSVQSSSGAASNAPSQSIGNTRRSNGIAQIRRPGRSSQLSHLPRLDSMKVVKKVGNEESTRIDNGGDRSANDAPASSDDRQRHSGEHASDTDDGDDTHGDNDVVSETESEGITDGSGDESEADTSANRSSSISGAPTQQSTGSTLPRSRPGEILLPPVPAFGNKTEGASSQVASTSNATSPPPIASGEDSWTRFDSAFTPFETPAISATPTRLLPSTVASSSPPGLNNARGPLISSSIVTQTPRGMPESSNSYFDLRPASTSRGEVPPSPSVITRSRATSNGASKRSITSPIREFPPLPPITPMQVRALEAMSKGPKGTLGPSASASPSFAVEKNEDVSAVQSTSPASMHSRPVSIASPQDVIASAQGGSERRAADMYNSGMPPPSKPNVALKQRQNSNRPSLYQQQSRSLIDLTAITARQMRDEYKPPPTPLPIPTPSVDDNTIMSSQQSSTVQSPIGTLTPTSSSLALRRRRSMFEVGAQPPPYAVIHKRPEGPQMIFPREEEGRESLPGYTCAVHIEGYLPRKMEFSSPGIQAKDRSWRRQYFVLHGTCLKVYKSDLSGENLMGKGAWGQVIEGVHVHAEPMNEDGPAVTTTSTGAKEGNAASASSTSHGKETSPNTNNHHSQGSNSGLTAAVEKVNALTGSFHVGSRTGLVKTYSLQGAESGLAADYLKRRHVVRVRVEGEQFLLQTRNDRHVVDWIEAFQAATNVSLDLERRPMPKFITLPRRRRRRRRGGAEDAAVGGANQEAMDIEEARRRSMMDANGAGGGGGGGATMSRSSSRRLPPARPLGLPGDESPDPSAAFDDMLREDQDDLMRREAAAM